MLTKKSIAGAIVVAAIIGLLALFVDKISPKDLTVSAMMETCARIDLYFKQSGSSPDSLELLPKRTGYANRTTDGWRRPLGYQVTTNGVIRLTSLGRDGLPGGTGEDEDISEMYQALRTDE